MFRRAKISVFFTLVGVLTASGALLNPEQRNPGFQPGGASALSGAAVVKPGQASTAVKLWKGVKVQHITPGLSSPVKVELNGRTLAKPAEAMVAPGAVKKAGGGW